MLSSKYKWLLQEPAPKILLEALKTHGVIEIPGPKNNPEILRWAKEVGVGAIYTHDETPWCALAVSYWIVKAGYKPPANPLWARDFLKWGTPVNRPMLGDVMIWERGSGGHVAIYVGEDETHYHVIGGNQSNAVTIMRKAKVQPKGSRLLGVRRSPFKIGCPPNVRAVKLAPGGAPAGASEA